MQSVRWLLACGFPWTIAEVQHIDFLDAEEQKIEDSMQKQNIEEPMGKLLDYLDKTASGLASHGSVAGGGNDAVDAAVDALGPWLLMNNSETTKIKSSLDCGEESNQVPCALPGPHLGDAVPLQNSFSSELTLASSPDLASASANSSVNITALEDAIKARIEAKIIEHDIEQKGRAPARDQFAFNTSDIAASATSIEAQIETSIIKQHIDQLSTTQLLVLALGIAAMYCVFKRMIRKFCGLDSDDSDGEFDTEAPALKQQSPKASPDAKKAVRSQARQQHNERNSLYEDEPSCWPWSKSRGKGGREPLLP